MAGSSNRSKKPLMRSLGEFVGHIVRGAKADPAATPGSRRTVVNRTVEEKVNAGPDGAKTVLRRTTIDEVEVHPPPPPTTPPPSAPPHGRATPGSHRR